MGDINIIRTFLFLFVLKARNIWMFNNINAIWHEITVNNTNGESLVTCGIAWHKEHRVTRYDEFARRIREMVVDAVNLHPRRAARPIWLDPSPPSRHENIRAWASEQLALSRVCVANLTQWRSARSASSTRKGRVNGAPRA